MIHIGTTVLTMYQQILYNNIYYYILSNTTKNYKIIYKVSTIYHNVEILRSHLKKYNSLAYNIVLFYIMYTTYYF